VATFYKKRTVNSNESTAGKFVRWSKRKSQYRMNKRNAEGFNVWSEKLRIINLIDLGRSNDTGIFLVPGASNCNDRQ
jgi:hypothetical protein